MTRTAPVDRTLTTATSPAALLLAACVMDTSGDSSPTASGGSAKVAAVIKGLDDPFLPSMEKGIEEQAGAGGAEVTVQAATSITDTTGQADELTGTAGQDSCSVIDPISGTDLARHARSVVADQLAASRR